MPDPSLYHILGVPADADARAIRQAYRRLAQRLHPDRNPGDPAAADRFVQIQHAYRVLGSPDTRQRYDAERAAPRAAPPPSPPVPARSLRRGDDLHVSAPVPLKVLYQGGAVEASGWVGQACPACALGCPRCGFAGQVLVERRWTVEVPAGHRPSQLLRFSRAGHTGPFFDVAGDVYLALRPRKSHGWRWSVRRQRIERTVRVPRGFLAGGGGAVQLRSPDGSWGAIDVTPASALSGWVRVKGLGLGPPGHPDDAWVRVRVGLWFSWGTRRATDA